MKTLKTSIVTGASIENFVEVFFYTALSNVFVTPTLTATNLVPLPGNYTARVAINDIIVTPERSVFVTGFNAIKMTGKPFVLATGDVVRISLKGGVNDVAANITTALYDVTPIDAQDFTLLVIPGIEQAIMEFLPTINLTVSNSRSVLSPAASLVKGCSRPIARQVKTQSLTPIDCGN
jgi:hypothetical protein